jgi:hypothetical protein
MACHDNYWSKIWMKNDGKDTLGYNEGRYRNSFEQFVGEDFVLTQRRLSISFHLSPNRR